jgi:hypothetical protein
MRRKHLTSSRQLLCLLAFTASPLLAQTATLIGGSGETVITPGLPFQAERITHFSRTLSNGTQILKETHETLARDEQGRFYDASTTTRSGGQPSTSTTVSYELADPVAGKMSNWSTTTGKGNERSISSQSHIVISTLPLPRDTELRNLKGDDIKVTTEDLGSKSIAGLPSTGTRTTTLIPQGRIGNTAPLLLVTERWTSTDLKITVAETETDPINGTRTSEFVSVKRTEPPASLFKIPDGIALNELSGIAAMFGQAPASPAR